MPVERPTFSESWYRVAKLKPRLRATVQVFRQHFRGQMWHVVQDPSSNQFSRLTESAYHFVALLDGRRTIADSWQICNDELGDAAPTQGEAIQLLGQLYAANLIQAELPVDAEGLFNRYKKRVNREVKGYLTNLLFIRIPLFDPDNILNEFLPAVGWAFSWIGATLLAMLISVAGYFVIGRADELVSSAKNILDPSGLPLLFVSFWMVKIIHEFGHCFSCKKFGKESGTGGEVHTLGVMFLVFTPLPYMDASSSWAFRQKWHRVIVGMGGMLVELVVASLAAIVWAYTSPGTVHAIAYNIMFIASVSTLLFNANPLLRFDGYYILSDILEIPNLNPRSKQYLYYLVRKYAWGVKNARCPAHTHGERVWFVFYGIASTLYRVVIVTGILLFITSQLPFIGMIFAGVAIFGWVFVPIGKLIKYLTTNSELMRTRGRAMGSVVGTLVLIVISVGIIPAPDRNKIEGVVEPVELAFVYPLADGFIQEVMLSDRYVDPDTDILIKAENPALEAELAKLIAQRDSYMAKMRQAETEDVATARSYARAIKARERKIADVRDQIALLELPPPIAGRWISPNIERFKGAYVKRGEKIGLVASDEVEILAVIKQEISAQVFDEIEIGAEVEIRVKGSPDLEWTGRIVEILPSGQKMLPSRALGYAIGGTMQTVSDDRDGIRTVSPFFEIRISPDKDGKIAIEGGREIKLLAGQRVMVRLSMSSKPLARQWWRLILQLVQRRFHS